MVASFHFVEVSMASTSSTSLADSWVRIWQMGLLQFQDWINFMGPFTVGGMFNTVNINSKSSADPDAEAYVTANVASYGRQLGRISEALCVVLEKGNLPELNDAQRDAVNAFRKLAKEIQEIKLAHKAKRVGMSVSDLLAVEKT
jgi:hypothetical protein